MVMETTTNPHESMFDKNYLMESYLEYHLRAIVTENGLKLLNNYVKKNKS